MVFKLNRFLPAALVALASMGAVTADGQDAKGIFLDKTSPGVKFSVILLRGDERLTVPTSYEFRSGDEMLFQFSLNRDAYVYVLTRTIKGDAEVTSRFAGSRGIQILQREDAKPRRHAAAYRLLFPLQTSGLQNRLTAGGVHSIPANGTRFSMDKDPGLEKLYLVLSPTPIDMKRYFEMDTGLLLRATEPAARSDHDALSALGLHLLEWNRNAQTLIADPASKGIQIEGYGVSSDSNHPALVEVDLKHSAQ
jgi:hypothetical protein